MQDDDAGTPSRLDDRNERAQLRRQLQESEETMRAFLAFAPAIIAVRDLDGRLLLQNGLFDARFLRPADHPGGATLPSIITPQLVEWGMVLEHKVVASGTAVRDEFEVTDLDGTPLIYEFTKFPLRTLDGEVYAVGTIGVEVTVDRRATEALRVSEERFRQLADNIDELFLLWEEGTLEMLYVSPAVERITGLDPERFADPAQRFAIVHPEDREIFSGPTTPVKDLRIVKPDGEIRWIRSRTTLIETADGSPGRGATTMTDITDQKAAELAADSARSQAEQANRAKSEFLSRMSHELRTPLNAVLGFGQLLESDERLHAEHRARAAQITKGGRHLLDLIDEVLDISRIESGQMTMSVEAIRLGDVIDDALELVRPVAAATRVRLLTDTGSWAQHVRVDRQRLEQVVLNLLTNAVKYNRPDGEVRIYCESPNHGMLRLMIVDTGIGMSPEGRKDLFTPFARLGAEHSDVEGTGLGLAHAKHLVEAMHGTIGVESERGVGSTFWVDLPVADPPPAREDVRHVPPGASVTTGDPTRTILFIEDNSTNVRLVQDILARRPAVSLQVATLGVRGLELAHELRPSLILLDVHLPDIDGPEVLRRLRADAATASIPVVAVSADATRSQIDQLLALGADSYITKPFAIDDILDVVDQPRP